MRNSGVVITNIVFMILALILGTVSYFLGNNVSEKKQQIAAAQKGLQDAKTENGNMTKDFTDLKKKLGYEEVADAKQLDETMNKDVQQALGSTEKNTTYRDVVITLGKNLAAKKAELAGTYQAQFDAAQRVDLNEQNKTESQEKGFDDTLATMAKEHQDSLTDVQKVKTDLQTSFDEQTSELNQLKDDTKKEIAVAKQETADFKESKEKFAEVNATLSKRVDDLSNASYEHPDATVVYADQVLKLVRLNVGERDGVQPLTTFNVFDPSTLDMNEGTAKGSVQVVRTIGEHMCEAKILVDQMSDPVKQGDLVYTPLWRPGEIVNYALDYRLDIDGDGKSDLDQIMTLIQAAGAHVSAYIEDDGKVIGEVKPDVYRVVLAEKSISDVLEHDYSMDDGTKEKITADEQKFIKSYKDLGVQTIELKDFLEKIGYKETASISRYREEGGVELQENGVGRQVVSPGVVAPNYQKEPDKAPESTGIVAPIYKKDAEKAPESTGIVSPYYTRKRSEKK